MCLHPTHTADPWDTEEREALTSVTAEVDSLKLIKATGVCGDERSEVGVPRAQGRAVRSSPPAPHPCSSPAHIFHKWPRQSHQGSQGCRHIPGSHRCSSHCCSGTGRGGSCRSTLDGGEVTLRHRAGAKGPSSTWPLCHEPILHQAQLLLYVNWAEPDGEQLGWEDQVFVCDRGMVVIWAEDQDTGRKQRKKRK